MVKRLLQIEVDLFETNEIAMEKSPSDFSLVGCHIESIGNIPHILLQDNVGQVFCLTKCMENDVWIERKLFDLHTRKFGKRNKALFRHKWSCTLRTAVNCMGDMQTRLFVLPQIFERDLACAWQVRLDTQQTDDIVASALCGLEMKKMMGKQNVNEDTIESSNEKNINPGVCTTSLLIDMK